AHRPKLFAGNASKIDRDCAAPHSDTANAIAEVKRLAQRGVELGKDDAIALTAGGWALAFVVRDLELGAALIDRALVLNSNSAEAWHYGGWGKTFCGGAGTGDRALRACHAPEPG